MNCVNLVGRLTAKPELRYTNNNIAYTRVTVVVDGIPTKDGERTADFISVVIWRKLAENVCQYLDKGLRIAVEGRLHTSTYTDSDNNKHYSMDVQANRIEFLENKRKESNPSEIKPEEIEVEKVESNVDPFADFGESVVLDDNFLD